MSKCFSRFIIVMLAVFGMVLAFRSEVARADDDVGITISPTQQLSSLDAGANETMTFKVLNNGNVKYKFRVYAQPYSVKGESYQADFQQQTANADVYKWVKFSKTEYELSPNESVDIPYTVAVPEGAAPGGHYGVIFAQVEPKDRDKSFSGVVNSQRVGMLMFMTVNGDYRTGGRLDSVSIPFFQFSKPLASAVRVTNTGNADFEVHNNVVVKSIMGKQLSLIQKDFRVLPDTSRKFDTEWNEAPTMGLFKVEYKTSFLDNTQSHSGYVFLAPLWFYLVLSILLLSSIVYVYVRKR